LHVCAPGSWKFILIIHGDIDYPGHPWIVDDAVAPDKPIDSAVLSRLKNFSAMNKLKKMALRVRRSSFLSNSSQIRTFYPIVDM